MRTVLLLTAAEPSILVNRALGLGSARSSPLSINSFEIRELYQNVGRNPFLSYMCCRTDCGPDWIAQLLQAAGYERYRGWMKFSRGPGDVAPVTTDLSIRRIEPEHAANFALIVADAFDFGVEFQPAIAALVNDPNWHVYMSFDGDASSGNRGVIHARRQSHTWILVRRTRIFGGRGAQTGVLNTRIRAMRLTRAAHRL